MVLKTAIPRATGCSSTVLISREILFNPDITHSCPRAPDSALRVHSVAQKVRDPFFLLEHVAHTAKMGQWFLSRFCSGALVD
jgi:hypothetical protein